MAVKLVEHTYGTHIYMCFRLDNGRIEGIDIYITENGKTYRTTADNEPETRAQIISAFHELY